MRRKKARRRSTSKKSSNLWLVTAVLIILFIAGLYYLKDHGKRRPTENAAIKEKTHEAKSKTKEIKNTAAPTTSQPQFDFYNMLSEPQSGSNANKSTPTNSNSNKTSGSSNNIIPPPSSTSLKNATVPTSSPKSNVKLQAPTETISKPENKKAVATNSKYILQVASLRDPQKVDELKAELTLNGFNVTTEKVTSNGAIEYRINVGPFTSLKSATADQRRLRRDGTASILVKIK